MSARPEVSVIIPCYRAAATIEACVTSVLAQQGAPSFEVVVVDSGDDDVAQRLARWSNVSLLRSADRLSPAAARNEGARHARGAGFAFLDADCVAPAGWLAAATDAQRTFDYSAVAGAVAPKSPGSVMGLLMHAVEFAPFLPRQGVRPTEFSASCNLFVTRGAFEDVGGFDERFERLEDVALGLALRNAGHQVLLVGDNAVFHTLRRGLGTALGRQYRAGLWSGRARRLLPLRGAALTRWPALVPALLPYRFVRVLRAALGADGLTAMKLSLVLFWPITLALLVLWTAGFLRGMTSPA